MALDFATGLFPTDFCLFLREFAQTNEGTVRRFMTWFRRFCSRALWWPIWSAVTCPDNDPNDSTLRMMRVEILKMTLMMLRITVPTQIVLVLKTVKTTTMTAAEMTAQLLDDYEWAQ